MSADVRTHLARSVLCLVFHTQDCDVSLSCSRIECDNDVSAQTLIEHLLLVSTSLNGRC
jgi:hypothetical protein